ncbi:RagB/SusD family nutrient uptake outer membrane protein [Chryseobacterium paridis]|uniref:RagB/SusD family nutrient uptake outer membrane protein n=1 Tax=Chryseobacterium paridis TaxID=2800328 RepID=A0ABS1FYN1_9FLAO|nr:RagB/SusD family nutrient uptake outer membrane protein [Chryseobacterium paridis]MBK1897556.1 RagB/SusD family nutrient uptake outer membrane protein [Chryseobacterium paridis]
MKKLNIYIILVIGVLGLNSCSQEILDTKPFNSVDATSAFSTPELIQLSVNGVYNAAQIGRFSGLARGYVFGAAYFQQNEARGEDVVNTQAFYQLTYESNYDVTTANNVYYWVDGYRLINRANLVNDGVEKAVTNGVISKEQGNIYKGEVLFFRALTHFEFLKHFSRPYQLDNGASMGVPYRTIGIETEGAIEQQVNLGRETVAEDYNKLLADLNFAEESLPTNAQRVGIDKISKVTKGAAIAIKIRIYLSMRDWQKVTEEYKKLESMYTLEANPFAVFNNNLGNRESIFSLNNTAVNNPGVNGALASQFNQRSLIAISPILWNNAAWLATDKRRDETAVVSGARFTRKYKDVTNYTDASPIVRFAEMKLAAAEAYARLNNKEAALKLLNDVRDRSLANPGSEAYIASSFATSADLVKGILIERRIELSCEGVRWSDIHRLINDDIAPTIGIPAKVPNGFPPSASYTAGVPYGGSLTQAIPYTDRRFLWPIPLVTTNVNPTLAAQQNPGY